jgi:hypothetical protein
MNFELGQLFMHTIIGLYSSPACVLGHGTVMSVDGVTGHRASTESTTKLLTLVYILAFFCWLFCS